MADRTSGGGGRGVRSDVWDLLPGYALDALDDLERASVERLLGSDADARRALEEYRDVVAAFAVEAEPPAGLRASVLDRVRDTPQEAPQDTSQGASEYISDDTAQDDSAGPSDAAGSPERGSTGPVPGADAGQVSGGEVVDLGARRGPRRWGVALTAVAAAAAIAVPTTIAVQVSGERDRLREQSETVAQMLADPDASILRGTLEGGGVASVLVADGDMFFRAEDLPDPGAGQAYQLWVVRPDGGVSSAGVLPLRDGATSLLVQGSEGVGMAVSVEPEAGSEQPTTDPVVVLTT
jgi:anti-sigma-K factor RskA